MKIKTNTEQQIDSKLQRYLVNDKYTPVKDELGQFCMSEDVTILEAELAAELAAHKDTRMALDEGTQTSMELCAMVSEERAAKEEAQASTVEACAKELDRLAAIADDRRRLAVDHATVISLGGEAVGYTRGAAQLRNGAWKDRMEPSEPKQETTP